MACVVLLRGVNVGGHRTFRPSALVRELSQFDVVNVGAAGTFVVRKPGSQAKLREAFQRKLPFEAEMMVCEGRDFVRLESETPFGEQRPATDVVRFLSVVSKRPSAANSFPIVRPENGKWLLRLVAAQNRFVFGEYRRDPRTIGYLGQIDKMLGVSATTRNWNTIMSIIRILKGDAKHSN